MSTSERARFESSMLQFVQSELETGTTFASLALSSQTDEKRHRNVRNARKAYDTAKHFLEDRAPEEIATRPDLRDRLTALRSLLVQLGEKFAE